MFIQNLLQVAFDLLDNFLNESFFLYQMHYKLKIEPYELFE